MRANYKVISVFSSPGRNYYLPKSYTILKIYTPPWAGSRSLADKLVDKGDEGIICYNVAVRRHDDLIQAKRAVEKGPTNYLQLRTCVCNRNYRNLRNPCRV